MFAAPRAHTVALVLDRVRRFLFNSTMPLKMAFATMIPANDNRPPDVARFYLQIGAIWLLPPALASLFVTVAWWLGFV
jgi:hypothetical protein